VGVAGIGSAVVVISAFMAVITGSEGAGGGLRSHKGGRSIKGGARPLRSHHRTGGGRRGPTSGDGGLLCSVGRRKKEAGWAKRPDGPAGCWAD
jgi:hypothetical protein